MFGALAFDLDGVVTDTAGVHASAWKRLLDELLARLAADRAFRPFDPDGEYRTHIDGRPRHDGLRSFLASRGIAVPEGAAEDSEDEVTIHGLAALKNRYVHEHLAAHGVLVYPDALALLRAARARGMPTAVVTSSANAASVLATAHIADLFDARVDGIEVARLGLRGKPAPDAFLEAARRLDLPPASIVVFEDAIAGVEAARAGGFGLVVGVERLHDAALREHGAHAVVDSLDAISLRPEVRRPPVAPRAPTRHPR
ncbi:MAG: beta-phosphoglucomutase family hydrolase [Deltaproteobacteria bacterium]|nr:beta-phosphoglucomutase family hydrolase [Deltaproteobacteria bacterium]